MEVKYLLEKNFQFQFTRIAKTMAWYC